MLLRKVQKGMGMGSSMIGMKGLLISEKTYEKIGSVIE